MTWLRRHAKVLLVTYSASLCGVLLSPTSAAQDRAVTWLSGALSALGAPDALIAFRWLEVFMNGLIIVPVTLLGSLVLPRLTLRDWTALGFLLAVTVETLQGTVLPFRHPSFSDVMANTTGAMTGAVIVPALHRWAQRSQKFPSASSGRPKRSRHRYKDDPSADETSS